MQARTLGHGGTALAVSLLAVAALAADEPVPALQDLMGAEGTTQFLFEGKPYFWVSDRRAAELELQSLR
jgi:hypothetical protein